MPPAAGAAAAGVLLPSPAGGAAAAAGVAAGAGVAGAGVATAAAAVVSLFSSCRFSRFGCRSNGDRLAVKCEPYDPHHHDQSQSGNGYEGNSDQITKKTVGRIVVVGFSAHFNKLSKRKICRIFYRKLRGEGNPIFREVNRRITF